MTSSTSNAKTSAQDPAKAVEWISRRTHSLEVVEPNPLWPSQFATLSGLIRTALGDKALSIEHVGSTSVPGLPAKNIIDIDLTVADPLAEEEYAGALQAAGFQFLLREFKWYDHRLFWFKGPYANVHVFGPGCPELTRHRLFRDWLRTHEDDRLRYAQTKRDASKATLAAGETADQYNFRKEAVIKDIYQQIYQVHGPVEG